MNKYGLKTPFMMTLIILLCGCDFEIETTAGGRLVSTLFDLDCREIQGRCKTEDYEEVIGNHSVIIALLKAIPDEGYRFSHWLGDCNQVRYHNCYVLMQGDRYVKAVFEKIEYLEEVVSSSTVRFVALGDAGEGNTTQYFVADAMQSACDAAGGCHFAIGLGDNIYDENPISVYDTAFETKFELPYQNIDFQFFMSLGNHDNDLVFDGLGAFNLSGDVQVAYTFRTDKLSDKWQMTDRYYQFSAPEQGLGYLVDFFVLDSNPLISIPDIAPDFEIENYKRLQRDWFMSGIAHSTADWKIVYGHHPFISNGQHGNAGAYDGVLPIGKLTNRVSGENFRQWFLETVCDKADVYFAGHDHDLQVLKSVPECGKTIFIISGAGAKSREFKNPTRNPAYWQMDNAAGFFLVEINGNAMNLQAYTVDKSNGEYSLMLDKKFYRRRH